MSTPLCLTILRHLSNSKQSLCICRKDAAGYLKKTASDFKKDDAEKEDSQREDGEKGL